MLNFYLLFLKLFYQEKLMEFILNRGSLSKKHLDEFYDIASSVLDSLYKDRLSITLVSFMSKLFDRCVYTNSKVFHFYNLFRLYIKKFYLGVDI